jgi:uncharacterized membrane protein
MDTQIFFLEISVVVFVLCLPLVFKLVPPNRVYGFRTSVTLSRPEIWYRANVFSGVAMMAAMALAAVTFLFMPQLSAAMAAVAFVSLVLAATAASFAYVNRIA